jgi:DNA-binding GntR family transcriptional regulator
VKISGNDALLGFFERLHLPQAHMFDETKEYEGRRRTRRDHHQLVQLLRRRDRAGERCMWRHLWENAEFLVARQNLESGDDGQH